MANQVPGFVRVAAIHRRGQRQSLSDLDAATADFKFQVSRAGARKPLKTDESLATSYPLPRSAAVMLKAHLDKNPHKGPRAFVFRDASGRAISQRNALRALYRAQERARKPDGTPPFPELFEDRDGNLMMNERGGYVRNDVPRKELRLPHLHGIRHASARDCDDLDEARDMLRHKDVTVTAKVYRPHMTAKRRSALRDRMAARERRRGVEALEAQVESSISTEGPRLRAFCRTTASAETSSYRLRVAQARRSPARSVARRRLVRVPSPCDVDAVAAHLDDM